MCIIHLHGEQIIPFLLLLVVCFAAGCGIIAYTVYKNWRGK